MKNETSVVNLFSCAISGYKIVSTESFLRWGTCFSIFRFAFFFFCGGGSDDILMQVFVKNDVIVADFFYLDMKAMMSDTFVRTEKRMHEKEICDSR